MTVGTDTASVVTKTVSKALVAVLPVLLPIALLALMIVAVLDDDDALELSVHGVNCAPKGSSGQSVAGYGPDQLANAALIVAAGKEMAVPEQGWVIAVATAMQESGLNNVRYGDAAGPDSRGLFQQRGNWGPESVRMDPKGAARLFYQQLLKLPGWQSMPLTEAAQAVQHSAFPWAYAKHEQPAREVVGAVEGVTCSGGGPDRVSLPGNPKAQTVVNAALAEVGVDYAWGGGDAHGPTRGISDNGGPADQHGDSNKIGFDCSGLALYAYAQIGVAVPHQTQAIWTAFQPAIKNPADVQPGDLILLTEGPVPAGVHHVAIYVGAGRVVEAPKSGDKVRVTSNIWQNPYWTSEFVGAVRPGV